MNNIIIVTSYSTGFPVMVAQEIIKSSDLNLCGVIISANKIKNQKKWFLKKLNKTFKIGIGGTINGLRMRKWYQSHQQFLPETPSLLDFCSLNKIPVFRTENTARPEKYLLDQLLLLSPSLGLSLGNSYISSKLFTLPEKGMLNVHHELLPDYPGGQSVIWPLFYNKTFTGYTIHNISNQIDAGEIISKEEIPIAFQKTLAETIALNYANSKIASAKKLPTIIKLYLENKIEPKPNPIGKSLTTPNLKQYLKIIRNFRNLRRDTPLGL